MSLANADLERLYYLMQLPANVSSGATQLVPGSSKSDSVANTGKVNNPTAGAAICSIASGSLPAGYYRISIYAYMEGAPTNSLDADNMEFRIGAVTKFNIAIPATSLAVNTRFDAYYNLDGSSSISVNATVTATTGANYHANITATRIG